MREADRKCLISNYFLDGLTHEQQERLLISMKEISLETGEFLIEEEEEADALYFVVEGILEVVRFNHVLDELKSGDLVGELAFLDQGRRSASVQAKVPSRVFSLEFRTLNKMLATDPSLQSIFTKMSQELSGKVRRVNEIAIAAEKARGQMGLFLINLIVMLCCFIYALPLLRYLIHETPNTSYVSFTLLGLFALGSIFFVRTTGLPLREFGITTNRWKESLIEGVALSVLVMVVVTMLKWLLIRYDFAGYGGHALFEPFNLIKSTQDHTLKYWLIMNVVYGFVSVPIQEFVARGALQGLMARFFLGKHREFFSIAASSLIFGATHVFFSVFLALSIFVFGCYLGWIYSRNKNLIGPSIAHWLVGTYALSVLGPVF